METLKMVSSKKIKKKEKKKEKEIECDVDVENGVVMRKIRK